jgi:hypothetical protein
MKRALIVFVALGVVAALILGGIAVSKRSDAESVQHQRDRLSSEEARLTREAGQLQKQADDNDEAARTAGPNAYLVQGLAYDYGATLTRWGNARLALIDKMNQFLRVSGPLTPSQRAEVDKLRSDLADAEAHLDEAQAAIAKAGK